MTTEQKPGLSAENRALVQRTSREIGPMCGRAEETTRSIADSYLNHLLNAARAEGPGPVHQGKPRPGEIRIIAGQRMRFIEEEIEGQKWEPLGPANPQEDVGALVEAWRPFVDRLTVFPHDLDAGEDEEVEIFTARKEWKRLERALASFNLQGAK